MVPASKIVVVMVVSGSKVNHGTVGNHQASTRVDAGGDGGVARGGCPELPSGVEGAQVGMGKGMVHGTAMETTAVEIGTETGTETGTGIETGTGTGTGTETEVGTGIATGTGVGTRIGTGVGIGMGIVGLAAMQAVIDLEAGIGMGLDTGSKSWTGAGAHRMMEATKWRFLCRPGSRPPPFGAVSLGTWDFQTQGAFRHSWAGLQAMDLLPRLRPRAFCLEA